MKLEKHRYDDIIILKFTGEFDTFNLPGFSERIDKMISQGDNLMILDLHLLKFINSAALGYLIKTSKSVSDKGGELVMARPSKFVKKTLSTLGLDSVFKMYTTVEDAIQHFKKGEDVGEWWIERDTLCRKWTAWENQEIGHSKKQACFWIVLDRKGRRVNYFNMDGSLYRSWRMSN